MARVELTGVLEPKPLQAAAVMKEVKRRRQPYGERRVVSERVQVIV